MAERIATALAAGMLAAGLAGCATFPEVDAAEQARALPTEAPRIVPVEPILARAARTGAEPEDAARLEARAALLRQKTAALRTRPF
ncbi:hypothetical protein [Rhodovulum marinum]|uniref:Beta-barrel assembly complex subunit BamF n=1 Tax=Rhodovulum marinum TaxID=320662 RepID=A0A4R2Q5V3_9RHOB|nr:hypothetical protein [Rhodovulum marinum]TCP43198.1 hypothetical protein EV662_102394 [Rhodovulum marinum]